MFDKIKSLLADWRVSVALIGGAIVVATSLGTCTFEPTVDESEAEKVEVPAAVGEESSTAETTIETTEVNTTTTENNKLENASEGSTTTE